MRIGLLPSLRRRRPRRHESPSSYCRSPTSPTILRKTIPPTASTGSTTDCRVSTAVSSSPQHRLHLQGQKRRCQGHRQGAGVRYVLEGSVDATPTGCVSTPSPSTRNPARISGRIDSRTTSWTCSSSRTKSSPPRSDASGRAGERRSPTQPARPPTKSRRHRLTMRGLAFSNQTLAKAPSYEALRRIRTSVQFRSGERRRACGCREDRRARL